MEENNSTTGNLGSLEEVFSCFSAELGKLDHIIPMRMIKLAGEAPCVPNVAVPEAQYDPDEAFESTVFYRSPEYQIKDD